MAEQTVTADVIVTRVETQLDRLYDVDAMLHGLMSMAEPVDGSGLIQRVARIAIELLDDITTQLDGVVLQQPEEETSDA